MELKTKRLIIKCTQKEDTGSCVENGAEYNTANVDKLNLPSNRVMKKLGFRIIEEGTFKK